MYDITDMPSFAFNKLGICSGIAIPTTVHLFVFSTHQTKSEYGVEA